MAETLPAAEWTRREDLAALVAALGAGQVRYVGGAVRDTLLGLDVRDIDVATPLIPQDVMSRLKPAGIKVIPTGIDHGTVTALLPDGNVEITTLRHDISTDGRRATVAFARDWREDAARRDFTLNALYAEPATLRIADYFGGLEDLAARRVRFIGDARERIREDHLRILRYFRFQARFGSRPADAGAEAACAELSATLKGLSRERIGGELLAILALPDPTATIARMAELGVLKMILPEARPDTLGALVAAEAQEGIAGDPVRRLAALLPGDPELVAQVAARLRLSNQQKKRLVAVATPPPANEPARALAFRIGPGPALDRLLLDGRDVSELSGWENPRFPLKGGEIVARGVTAGPEVARILRKVEERWIAEGFPDAARVERLLQDELAQRGA